MILGPKILVQTISSVTQSHVIRLTDVIGTSTSVAETEHSVGSTDMYVHFQSDTEYTTQIMKK
jgi:hypothetical protein